MKLNNRGFAISAVLYSVLIIFMLIFYGFNIDSKEKLINK